MAERLVDPETVETRPTRLGSEWVELASESGSVDGNVAPGEHDGDVVSECRQARFEHERAVRRCEFLVAEDLRRLDPGLAADERVQRMLAFRCAGVICSGPLCSCSIPGLVFWEMQWAETTM